LTSFTGALEIDASVQGLIETMVDEKKICTIEQTGKIVLSDQLSWTIPANAQGETVPLQITVTVTAVVAMVAPPTPVTVTV